MEIINWKSEFCFLTFCFVIKMYYAVFQKYIKSQYCIAHNHVILILLLHEKKSSKHICVEQEELQTLVLARPCYDGVGQNELRRFNQ